jgi:Fatty acid hydroxylase superfamily
LPANDEARLRVRELVARLGGSSHAAGMGGVVDALDDTANVEAFRDRWLIAGFTLRGHVIKTLAVATGILGLAVALAWNAPAWQWGLIPLFWVVANFFEWAVHRFPMHRPLQPRILYDTHAKIHHRAYDSDRQAIRHLHDLSLVMMPWYTLLLVFAMASPITLATALVGGWGLAGVFLVAAVGYFLVYETIHTLHHLPGPMLGRSRLGRAKWLGWLRRHHHRHHRLEHMTKVNFNVTFPLADAVMRTYERDPSFGATGQGAGQGR